MIRQVPWWLCAALLTQVGVGYADVIRGYVQHGLLQATVAEVEVAFLIGSEDGAMTPMASTVSDEEGRFEFSGPFLRAGTSFALSADYAGVSYPSSQLVLGDQDEVIVEVYDVGGDVADLQISSHNIFLGLHDQTLEVAHLVQANNLGQRTYVGPVFGEHQRGLEFVVPEQLSGLVAHTGELIRLSPTRLFDTQSLPPGSSQVAFTFQVHADAFDGTYVHEILYPTQNLDLFLQPVTVELGPPFHDHAIVNLHGQQYRHYRAQDVPVGERLSIELPVSRPLRWALKWALLALVPTVLIGIMAVARRPVRLNRGDLADPTQVTNADSVISHNQAQHQILRQLADLRQRRAQSQGAAAMELDRQLKILMQQARDIYRRLPPS